MSTPLPQHCPTARELADLELIVSGALAPLDRFNAAGSPVTLRLPEELQGRAVELVDPEGLPLARLDGAGAVEPLTHAQFGPFRRLYLTPAAVREQYAGATFVPVTGPLTDRQIERLADLGTDLVLLVLAGPGTPEGLSPIGLIRATLTAAGLLSGASVVVVPLAARGDREADHALGVQVVENYAAGDPVLALAAPTDDEVHPAPVRAIIDFDRPPPDEQGLVLFFTGLSGSGKSTLAQALMDRLLEQGTRTVTSLDGDVVRRNLSAGLTFSKADRETNIRRIGWVAAEISRHGGVAVCSPIAPFDETRQQVRAMVDEAGGAFFLVHVATPLAECERRDRKGLYAKARRGEIPEFTGISSPYEIPEDADVSVDTTGRSIEDALDDVLSALREAGYLDLGDVPEGSDRTDGPHPAPETPEPETPEPADEQPLKVLFVCTANICRSAYMDLYARRAVADGSIEFSSAGTHGFREHEMDAVMATTLTGRGVDHVEFRSRALTGQMIEEADLVLTAESTHRAFILDDHPAAFRKVFTLGQFTEAVRRSASGASGRDLIAEAAAHRGAADLKLDIADPYSRGSEAAEGCAVQISAMLDVVLPALAGTGSDER